jgi:hypothetical protein
MTVHDWSPIQTVVLIWSYYFYVENCLKMLKNSFSRGRSTWLSKELFILDTFQHEMRKICFNEISWQCKTGLPFKQYFNMIILLGTGQKNVPKRRKMSAPKNVAIQNGQNPFCPGHFFAPYVPRTSADIGDIILSRCVHRTSADK